LSNLDAKLRLELRAEIRRICHEYQLTTVYVTHDQKEALSMADRLAVMDNGRILQVGTPREVYQRPHSRTVAKFIGETDFLAGRVMAIKGATVAVGTAVGNFDGVMGNPAQTPVIGEAVTLSIRPECWELRRQPASGNYMAGRIGEALYLGDTAQYEFIAPDGTMLKIVEKNPRFMDGAGRDELFAAADPRDVVVLRD
jgi:iron(III) transport system ATP-binding protein